MKFGNHISILQLVMIRPTKFRERESVDWETEEEEEYEKQWSNNGLDIIEKKKRKAAQRQQ